MFALVTYDIDQSDQGKRLRKVAKCCEGYGVRVQNSVFELVLTEGDLKLLSKKLEAIIDKKKDSIRIYRIGKEDNVRLEVIGKKEKIEVTEDSSIML